jgi:hypothetical protein
MFQPDDLLRIQTGLAKTLEALTNNSVGLAWALYRRYRDEEHILAPLLTFRGNDFEAAILDMRGTDPGFPAKRYNLLFLLRRGIFEELDEDEYLAQLRGTELEFVIMVIAVSCVKLLSAHNSTQHTSRKHKV